MNELIGIIPAAGKATRLYPYVGGKELLPVGQMDGDSTRPKIVSQYIIEAMANAGVKKIIIIVSPQKYSLMNLHLNGVEYGMNISYIVQNTPSMAHSIDLAYEWCNKATVIMGMPDTVVRPTDSARQLLKNHRKDNAELSLALYPTNKAERFGMVKVDPKSNIIYHKDKPTTTDATYMWGLAVWEPSFTKLLHSQIQKNSISDKEMALGEVFDVALQNHEVCKGYPIKGGTYYDIGTYEDYKKAILEL